MSWRERSVMEERLEFVRGYLKEAWPMTELCEAYGVSRKTGYKFVRRYEEEGIKGLSDRSKAPKRHPHAIADAVVEKVVEVRKKHPTWGPRKVIAYLKNKDSKFRSPAASTVGDVFKREGLVRKRRKISRSFAWNNGPFREVKEANQVWCADFKGSFQTRDGSRCEPLTITDAYSRFLLKCEIMQNNTEQVRSAFEETFRKYGMPKAIRTDNGPPFASTGLGGLSHLSVWWIKLGIIPQRITPGKPQQNGRHERFHLTLKQDTLSPPQQTRRDQQKIFDEYRLEFNQERPHEALGNQFPKKMYRASRILYPKKVLDFEYPMAYRVRSVRGHGDVRWKGAEFSLSSALIGERIGFYQITENLYKIYFGPLELAVLDESKRSVLRYKTPRWVDSNEKVLPMSSV